MSVSAYKMHITRPRLDFDLRQKKHLTSTHLSIYLTKIPKPVNTNDYSYGESCLQVLSWHSASGLLIVV